MKIYIILSIITGIKKYAKLVCQNTLICKDVLYNCIYKEKRVNNFFIADLFYLSNIKKEITEV